MVRRGAVILLGMLVALFLVIASWPYLAYDVEESAGVATGNSIKDAVSDFYDTSSLNQRIFILSQVLLLIAIAVVVFIIFGKLKPKEKLHKVDFLKKSGAKRSRTDIDILYEILKERGEIEMEEIEDTFDVSKEVAVDWSKVLENGNLAVLDYPRFGKPILRLANSEKEAEVKDEGELKKEDGVEGEEKIEEGKQSHKNVIDNEVVPAKENVVKKMWRKIKEATRKVSKDKKK